MTPDEATRFRDLFNAVATNVAGFIQGKRGVIELSLVCLLAEGHLLIEDVPGVGKTSLARSIAASLGMTWHRIQFTPDLLPSDVTGVSVFRQDAARIEFHPGPIFAHIVLADEINRASPRTQSALLEVMEERTVTVDGVSYTVPSPFMVIATQNPVEMDGTFPLPEAQVDRFLMMVSVGYPDLGAETQVLANLHAGVRLEGLQAVASESDVSRLISSAAGVHVAPSVMDYIVRLVGATRTVPGVRLGASPRGSVGLLKASRVLAASQGRHFVTPQDVQRLAEPVLAHRLVLTDVEAGLGASAAVVAGVVASTAAPQG